MTVWIKKMLLLAGVVLALGIAAPVYGSLGESDAQLASRYGIVQAEDTNPYDGLVTKCYSHDGLWIRARFLKGCSQSEAFFKLDKSALSGSAITALLDANDLGGTWTSIYKSENVERWILGASSAVALYYPKDHILVITTKGMMRFIAEKGKVDEK